MVLENTSVVVESRGNFCNQESVSPEERMSEIRLVVGVSALTLLVG